MAYDPNLDAIVAWGDEQQIADRIRAHHDAGADHVCIQPLRADGVPPFRPALFVYSRVVSASHDGFVTIDAGSKTVSTDGPLPRVAFGADQGAAYAISGDEFGRLELPPGSPAPKVGDLVALQVPHCDTTINLFDHYHCLRGDALVALWPIEARGASG